MNQNWSLHKLSDVISLEYGKPLPKEQRFDNGQYPAYGANGIKCRTNDSYWDKPSIIVGRKGSAGEVNLVDAGFWPLDVTYYVTFDVKKYDLNFLFYMLKRLNLTSLAKGVKPGINRNDVYSIKQSFPLLPEQKRIVAILDEAFAEIDSAMANTEKNLGNARELFESYMESILTKQVEGCKEETLSTVCEIKPPKQEARKLLSKTDLVSFVPMKNLGIRQKELKLTEKKSLGEVVGSYTYFAENDVLLAKITPCFENGKLGIARNLTNGIGFGSSEYIVFRSNGDIDPDYLYYFLSRDSFRESGASIMTGAVGHKRVPKEFIENHKILLQPLSEQKIIVKNLDELSDKINELESIYKQKLSALSELKQSLLQKAFSGELTTENDKLMDEAVA